jgi:GDP-L-fucose synthase
MGGMIKRFVDAVENDEQEVQCWGSGAAKREFLYAEDAAKLLIESMLKYDDSTMPLNLGTGQEVSVKELAQTVASSVGFTGQITWDTSKPDGQLRKLLDISMMKQVLGETSFTSLSYGIAKTVEYYRNL